MLPSARFQAIVEAAARAPSADNMQAWAFRRRADGIDVLLDRSRLLPTDAADMFGWIGVGAAVENATIAAAREGLAARVEPPADADAPVVLRLSRDGADDPLAEVLPLRETNRAPYDDAPLPPALLDALAGAARGRDAGVHWIAGRAGLERVAEMDAGSTFIRLEHAPLRDELFDVLRYTREEVERTRFGLDFESLGVPPVFARIARRLRRSALVKVASRLGLGRVMARQMADRLRTAGALCLVTARRGGPAGYVEAGRAMERIWLAATAAGLAVQPHGVLPQYLTKVEVEPGSFLPRHAAILGALRGPFDALFPEARAERPAILLRVGRPTAAPARRSVRLPMERLVRE
jgi:nitroreductase